MTIDQLKDKAESLCVDEIEWLEAENGNRVVGIDWFAGDIYIIDPESPDYPQIEIAQFDGIDQLFNGKEN
jgi:hypothetical protein